MSFAQIKKLLQDMADPTHATQLQRFFKTGPGQYGEGDVFIGIRMPDLRKVAKAHVKIAPSQILKLLHSKFHEHRMLALLILTYQYPKASPDKCAQIYRCYMDNLDHINNWDLVDVTAPHIVGAQLMNRSKKPLYRLADSSCLWERRVAIVATIYFIRRGQFADTLKIAAHLLTDKEDLIHKAVGWMLREVGKRDVESLEAFLRMHYSTMPRTMLRYAIERLPEPRRRAYLKGTI